MCSAIVHVLGEFAGIVGEGEPGLERHRVGRDGVFPPQLRRIDAELVGGDVDDALDDVGGFRPAVAAIGPHRIGVGEHRRHVGIDGGRLVDARQRAEIAHEGLPADLQESAHIGDDVHAQAKEVAILVERKLGVGHIVARLAVAEEGLGARTDPLHRAAGDLGRPQHQRHLVIDGALHAEGAADVAGDDAYLVLRHLQHGFRQLVAEREVALERGVDRVVVVVRAINADRAARLHARRGDAVDHEVMLDDMGRFRERGVGRGLVAFQMHEADVVGAVVPDQRGAGLDRVARSK